MKEVIKIPFAIPSRNQLDKMHWTEKSKLRKQYELFIRSQMNKQDVRQVEPGTVANIRIVTYRKKRIRDHTNLIGGFKLMEDALSNELFIWDDAEKYIGKPLIDQDLCHEKAPYTLIEREIL